MMLAAQSFTYTPSFVLLDMDETVFMHWDGLHDVFADVQIGIISTALKAKNVIASRADIHATICKSLELHCLGTFEPAKRWGLDHGALHRGVHQGVFDTHIRHVFAEKAAPHQEFYRQLREKLAEAISLGVGFALLTHGDDYWAHNVPKLIGIDKHVPYRRGIDAFGWRLKTKHDTLFRDVLKGAGFSGTYNSVVKADDRTGNLLIPAQMGMQAAYIRGHKGRAWLDAPEGVREFEDILTCLDSVIASRKKLVANHRSTVQARLAQRGVV